MVIDTDGKIRFCTNSLGEDGVIGILKENGKTSYRNKAKYEEELLLSSRNLGKCRDCIELPFCIGGCQLARASGNTSCDGSHPDGLTLTERARLDYYSDESDRSMRAGKEQRND